jgi:hypothetical protein
MLDTGVVQRNLANGAAGLIVSRLLGMNNVEDFGGGDGLLCRLLRDYGINCFVNDKYASATYALGYSQPDFPEPDLLLSFEVLEHFENPRNDLHNVFARNPKAVLASTGIYRNQDPDWWYLTPETGQHVFFYGETALELIAQMYEYKLLICGGYILFIKPQFTNQLKNSLLKVAMNRWMLRLLSAMMRLLPARGVWKDFNSLRAKLK